MLVLFISVIFHYDLWEGYVITNSNQLSIGYMMSVGL